jgi:predicted nucleic acid-binding protein
MTAYLDTSSLVKLYIVEPDSLQAREQIGKARALATSRIAYAEARSALARRRRDGSLSDQDCALAVADFTGQWPTFLAVEVTQVIVESAGELSERYGLRGFDAIHLASAKALSARIRTPVRFFSSDHFLAKAAMAEGLG